MLTFEQTQKDVAEVKRDLKELKAFLFQKSETQSQIETPLNIKDVAKLTELSVPTLYGYVQRNEIPYYKMGNRLKFFKSEIIDWIKTGRQKTLTELNADVDLFLSNKKRLK
jgi:excisionase family DNA binding protein